MTGLVYDVFMCDTKLVSLRMPVDVLAELDRIAEEEGRSRAQVIIRKCSVVTQSLPAVLAKPEKPAAKPGSKKAAAPVSQGECPHDFGTKEFCKTMKGGCQ